MSEISYKELMASTIHFVGIGGGGMSGIARILLALGVHALDPIGLLVGQPNLALDLGILPPLKPAPQEPTKRRARLRGNLGGLTSTRRRPGGGFVRVWRAPHEVAG